MLNKLLKRCMPWMDKGRWMQIRVVGTEPTNIRAICNDDKVVSVGISPDDPAIRVIFAHVPHIIDLKFCPEVGFELQILPGLDFMYVDNTTIDLPIIGPGTYWLFMR